MRLSDDRIAHLSHRITEVLAGDPRVQFNDTWNGVRLAVQAGIGRVMHKEAEITQRAEARARSLSRNVPEGSAEWNVLVRQYYDEEIDKLRSIR